MVELNPSLLMVSNANSSSLAGGLNAMSESLEASFKDSFAVTHIFVKDSKNGARIRRLLQTLSKLRKGDHDIVYFNSIYYLEFLVFAFICTIYSVPYQIHSHGSLSKFAFNERSIKKTILRPLLRYLVNNSHTVIFSTHSESSNSICPNRSYITFQNYLTSKSDIPANIKKREKHKLVFISKIDWKYKGLLEMIEGFKRFSSQCPEFELHIYGYGNTKVEQFQVDRADPAIIRLFTTIENVNNIFYHGPIYGTEKWKVISECGAICLFSKSEAMPLILTESISLGTVALFSIGSNYSDIVTDKRLVCDVSASAIEKIFFIYKLEICPNYIDVSKRLSQAYEQKLSDRARKLDLNNIVIHTLSLLNNNSRSTELLK